MSLHEAHWLILMALLCLRSHNARNIMLKSLIYRLSVWKSDHHLRFEQWQSKPVPNGKCIRTHQICVFLEVYTKYYFHKFIFRIASSNINWLHMLYGWLCDFFLSIIYFSDKHLLYGVLLYSYCPPFILPCWFIIMNAPGGDHISKPTRIRLTVLIWVAVRGTRGQKTCNNVEIECYIEVYTLLQLSPEN